MLGFLDRSCESGPCDRRDVCLGVLSFKGFCLIFILQGVNILRGSVGTTKISM